MGDFEFRLPCGRYQLYMWVHSGRWFFGLLWVASVKLVQISGFPFGIIGQAACVFMERLINAFGFAEMTA